MKSSILRHIGLALLLMLPLWGCQVEPLSQIEAAPEGNTVRLKLDIEIPDYAAAATKTDFVDTPVCTELYVIVFDEADFLSEIVEATVSGSDFTVDLHPSALPRTLHFLALPSGSPVADELESLLGSKLDEPSFATRLSTKNGDAACWARKVLTAGISADTDLSGIKMVRNYAKVYIRNTEAETHFRLESFKVYNAAKYGMALPFNGVSLQNTGGFNMDLFPVFFDGSGNMRDYADVNGVQGYRGYPHPSGELRTPVTADASSYASYALASNGTDAVYDYIFETRYNPEKGNDNPYILFQGKYSGTNNFDAVSSTWYKADFVYADPDSPDSSEWGDPDRLPYDILRNYAYVLTIEGVIGEGHTSPEYAASQPARNNFDGSVVGIDISGVKEYASALYLSQTAIELPRNPDIEYIDLYYRNENPKDTAPTNDPAPEAPAEPYVRISLSGDTIIDPDVVNTDGTLNLTALVADPNGISEAIDASHASIADMHLKSGAWWHLRLPVIISSAETGTLQQTITIRNRTGLSRHCIVSVRPHYPFEIVGYQQNPAIVAMEESEPAGGDVVRVNFRIPSGMPEALFPMEFKVESFADGLTSISKQVLQPKTSAIEDYEDTLPDGDFRIELPVTGNSLTIVGEDANDDADLTFRSYHYTRTLTWAEYCNASADAKFMKTFPVFLEPLYNPRNSSEVTALGTTTVWMRQGERDATYFSYKDDAGLCTRRMSYKLVIVEDTRIVLPAGDATYDGKPVYEVPMDAPRNLTIGVVRDDNGVATPNPLTLSKTATQFSLSPLEASGSITTRVDVSEVTGERYLVTVHASTAQDGVTYYGESDAQFYVKPVRGTRIVSFPDPQEVTILKNQTVSSATSGTLQVNTDLQASCPKLLPGERLIYSLSPSSVVTSNAYVEIVQSGSSYTVRGKSVVSDSSVKIYAIAEEDANYERAVAEMTIKVEQGEMQLTGWWDNDSRYVGQTRNLTLSVSYGSHYSIEHPVSYAGIFKFYTSDANVSYIHNNNDGTAVLVASGLGLSNPDSASETATLTLVIRGTDDNGDGEYGDPDNDIFPTRSVTQSVTVAPCWWKVLNGPTGVVNNGVYAISDGADARFIKTTQGSGSSDGYYDETVILFGRDYRFYAVNPQSYTPTAYADYGEGGKYLASSSYSYVITSSNGIYSLKVNGGSNYLLPRLSQSRSGIWAAYSNDSNTAANYLALTIAGEDNTKGWTITGSGQTLYFQGYAANDNTGNYLNYNTDKSRFDCRGSSENYVHLWRKCTTLSEVVASGYGTFPAAP